MPSISFWILFALANALVAGASLFALGTVTSFRGHVPGRDRQRFLWTLAVLMWFTLILIARTVGLGSLAPLATCYGVVCFVSGVLYGLGSGTRGYQVIWNSVLLPLRMLLYEPPNSERWSTEFCRAPERFLESVASFAKANGREGEWIILKVENLLADIRRVRSPSAPFHVRWALVVRVRTQTILVATLLWWRPLLQR